MKFYTNQPKVAFSLCNRKTRKAIFLDEIGRVVPWARLVDLIAPHYPAGHTGRTPFALETMLPAHFLQHWLNLSVPAMEEAFFDTPLYREFVGLDDNVRLPDESTILRFRHRLERHDLADKILAEVSAILTERGLLLKQDSAVDANLIAAPSTISKGKSRDPEMHSSQKGIQWYFGMKAHIGVDADSGLVHTVRCTSGTEHSITQAHRLLQGQEKNVWADAGYQGVEKRPGADPAVTWYVAMRPVKRKNLKHASEMGELLDKVEKLKAGICTKVVHPFRVIKRQFPHMKTRYRGLKKNTAQIAALFALSNLWMARHDLMGART
ncbi:MULTISPECIES: IS5 family transposase [Comamonadaceae]|uniref:IS5 family transposase n=1 Tax=Comamonadaceae TaxID=80864 RepID=UPI00271C103D|nr:MULTISPECIES: IS5 family transposase [Comamonadaceae]MDO9145890.1 IS5 family transposase [Rhodoferax sp.]MDP3887631.1 IS5 family transposase [Hydrogenophaga sp.]